MMDIVGVAGQGLSPDKGVNDDASQSPKSAVGDMSTVPQPIIVKAFSAYNVCLVVIFISVYFRTISAQDVPNFAILSNFSCASNMICLWDAHAYGGDDQGVSDGSLSLLDPNTKQVGIAYHKYQVRLLDRPSNQTASFATNFTIYMELGDDYGGGRGDGMTFLISGSADNNYRGEMGGSLGIFNSSGSTPFKSIVVEFDTFYNEIIDISDNHVSFDFGNLTAMATINTSTVNVDLGDGEPKYVWLEYSRDTQQLEVRISYNNSKPVNPLLNHQVDLFDFVDEYMWVGFSSSAGDSFSNFFIGNWTFESHGIPASTVGVSRGSMLGRIIGVSVGVLTFGLACMVGLGFLLRWRRSGRKASLDEVWSKEEDPIQLEGMPERFSYKHLSDATGSFSEEMKLGEGGFGSVYRGKLPSSGMPVAVKKISSDSKQGEKEFMAEVSIISRLRHRNLIQLQGWCKDAARGKYLLVYDLMPNGSLNHVLFGPGDNQSACLTWKQRFNIVTGTAAALDYLHLGWKQQVIHRDVKSSNIMLDAEWNAKLGDFGLARLVDHQRAATTTMVAGTYGYISPEAATTGRFTEKSDVFAFGAVVLEIACGRRAFCIDFPPGQYSLVDWVWQSLSEGALLSTVDKRLVDYDTYWMNVVLIVGLWCSHPDPLARPSMRHVVQVLAGDTLVPSIPASKPTAVFSIGNPAFSMDALIAGKFSFGSSTVTSKCISSEPSSNSDVIKKA